MLPTFHLTVMIQCFRTIRSEKTAQTQIREQTDQHIHLLQLGLHRFGPLPYAKTFLFEYIRVVTHYIGCLKSFENLVFFVSTEKRKPAGPNLEQVAYGLHKTESCKKS